MGNLISYIYNYFGEFSIISIISKNMGNCTCSYSNSAKVEETSTREFTVKSPQDININAFNGNITVETVSGKTVTFQIIKKANSDEDLKHITCDVSQTGDTITAISKRNKRNLINSGVSINVQVPENSNLNITTSNGNVTSNGLFQDIITRTSNGSIKFDGGAKSLDLKSSNGSITISNSIMTKVNTRTSNGRITFAGMLLDNYSHTLQTSNSNIKCHLRSVQSVSFTASTSNGNVRSSIPTLVTSSSSSYLAGIINGGVSGHSSCKLNISTSNGNISIK